MVGAAAILKVLITVAIIVAGSVLAIWGLIKGTQGLIWLLGKGGRGIAFLVKHVFGFVGSMITDTLRTIGALLTALVLIPLVLLNFLFGRWRASVHFAQALEDEIVSFGLGIYRVALGNPLHFIGMGMITDGIERRIPETVARTPRSPRARVKDGKFDGYKVTGVLPAGGSGARLFLAKPRTKKLEELTLAGHPDPGQVVIKAFSLSAGSTLPQIVRESRALESARRLGLVLEHELTDKSFHYVMPYVPGDGLDVVMAQMHEKYGDKGLSDRQLRVAMGYVGDLLYTLDAFHTEGLWHKDIKPNNLIISEGRAHLVDLGLVTPLASAMTLTTHGTEYYRDPEMVRQALKGVKVHEVNGVKFDLYSTGAVLYSLLENSFPAQGSLSRITRRCPEALSWIVRRAMADIDGRYGSAQEMLSDIRTVLTARDPFSVRPADLPSVNGRRDWSIPRASFASGTTSTQSAKKSKREWKPSRKSQRHTATAEKVQRRSASRSLAAAALGTLFLAGLAGVGIMAAEGSGPFAEGGSRGHDTGEWTLSSKGEWIPRPSGIPSIKSIEASAREAQRTAERHYESIRRQWSQELDKGLDRVRAEYRRISRAAGQDTNGSGTVLLLQDLSPTSDRDLVKALHSELERREFTVFGNPADGIGDERDITYLAGARKAVGISDLNDVEALARLELYLAESPSLDALVWVSAGEADNELQYSLVYPRQREDSRPHRFAVARGRH